MQFHLLFPILFVGLALHAADKGPPVGKAASKALQIEATAYLDRARVAQAVGGHLDEGIVVVEVKLTPLAGEKLAISRDDFLLRSFKDGQKSKPYSPSELAGSSVLRVGSRAAGGGGVGYEESGPVWGGIGGPIGRMPGSGGGIGNSAGATEAVATIDESKREKESPLLAVLKEKILLDKETAEPVSGQLYFLLEGKHKAKDLELEYKGPAGKIFVPFK